MIRSVTITNFAGEAITIELTNPWEHDLAITNIDGIGPAEATINTTDYASTDGSFFNSARVENRNIVISIKPLGNVEHNRHVIYDYFPTKKPVTLLITADEREVEITGYVEHNEVNIFDSFETAQISIICPNPFFHTPGDGINEIFSGIDAEFEFPTVDAYVDHMTTILPAENKRGLYSIQYETDNRTVPYWDHNGWYCYPWDFSKVHGTPPNPATVDKRILFGEILKLTEKIIVYEGEADTGMVMTFHAIGGVHNLMIYNGDTREVMYISSELIEDITGHDIQYGDDITISTVVGDKYATLYREGTTYNILNAINIDADWMQIHKGENRFIYAAEQGVDMLECSFNYYALYDGV